MRLRLGPWGWTLAAAATALVIAVVVALASSGGGRPSLPLPGIGRAARAGDPFAYVPPRQVDFVQRATAGNAQVLYAKSPGGALATAARVAAFRVAIDAATAGTGIDPNVLEGIVFVESAGRPNVIAGADPANAAGLTQILAETGQSLLGMHVDLARSRRLTGQIALAFLHGHPGVAARLERQRAGADDRFNPRKSLRATVRYLELAERRFGRGDLAVVSYHMGIGNLRQVLADYDGGAPVPYAQLYFDTAPDHHAAAYKLLRGFGDDSWTYYWRVLAAAQIMALYRSDRGELARLSSLQTAMPSAAEVLHPPSSIRPFANPDALASAYSRRAIVPLPSNAAYLGLAYDPTMGSLARQLGTTPALYRGLRPAALDLLVELAARVRALAHGAAPLIVADTVTDASYQQRLGVSDPPAAAGWSFTIVRRYVNRAQAVAFQSMLDRLRSLNLIAWTRFPSVIEVTAASDASQVIVNGV